MWLHTCLMLMHVQARARDLVHATMRSKHARCARELKKRHRQQDADVQVSARAAAQLRRIQVHTQAKKRVCAIMGAVACANVWPIQSQIDDVDVQAPHLVDFHPRRRRHNSAMSTANHTSNDKQITVACLWWGQQNTRKFNSGRRSSDNDRDNEIQHRHRSSGTTTTSCFSIFCATTTSCYSILRR